MVGLRTSRSSTPMWMGQPRESYSLQSGDGAGSEKDWN
jgi:hypothetical protein